MIPMFRVDEMGNERATTSECLSDAQTIAASECLSGVATARSVVGYQAGGRFVEAMVARLEECSERSIYSIRTAQLTPSGWWPLP
jgi:hypothetical protein